jgi:hypothetical protein
LGADYQSERVCRRLTAEQPRSPVLWSEPLRVYAAAGLFRRSHSEGTKPADLPVELPVEFAANLKTAKALGLEASPMLVARADEVVN